MRRIFALIIVIGTSATAAPVVRHPQNGIAGQFLVLLASRPATESVDGIVRSLAAGYNLKVDTIWQDGLRGFMANGSDVDIDRLANDPRVEIAEQNFRAKVVFPTSATQSTTFNSNYLWYLDRLDELTWTERDNTYNSCPTANNVYAYVIDQGVWPAHPEFEGRVQKNQVYDFSWERADPSQVYNLDNDGCGNTGNGPHATWVAGSLAGGNVGASKAKIISIQVIGCGGDTVYEDYWDALNWIGSEQNPYRRQLKFDPSSQPSPAVVNQSNFIPKWDSHYDSYAQVVKQFVLNTKMPFFKSADNFNADACQFSPNQEAYTTPKRFDPGLTLGDKGTVFVVGGMYNIINSSDNTDYRWYQGDNGNTWGPGAGSNGGACVSIYAPAKSIYVANNNSGQLYATISGTSFASPLVAGMAARYLAINTPFGSKPPEYWQVYNFLLDQATRDVVGVSTTEQWACGSGTSALFYLSPPVGGCPMAYPNQAYYPSVGNSSQAKVVFWNSGPCM